MALDFPTPTSIGQVYSPVGGIKSWIWTGEQWSAVTTPIEEGASVTVSDTPPSGASAGDLWFDSSSGVTSVYYDGTWVDVGGGDSGTSAGSVNGIVKADGAGNFSAAVAGTDYLTPSSPMSVKAWVVFDGFATFPATLANSGIKAAYNVSSVTEAQLGAYDINFQTPFDTSEYAIAGSACAATPDPAAKRGFYPGGKPTQTTTKCRIETSISGGGTGLSESDRVYVIIFSN